MGHCFIDGFDLHQTGVELGSCAFGFCRRVQPSPPVVFGAWSTSICSGLPVPRSPVVWRGVDEDGLTETAPGRMSAIQHRPTKADEALIWLNAFVARRADDHAIARQGRSWPTSRMQT